ncbi:hypothetical protein [Rhodohalobacter halophilus]|nr:hypothetical protein [Rhodohalobacter halophilus]
MVEIARCANAVQEIGGVWIDGAETIGVKVEGERAGGGCDQG